ncbi:MAG: zinc ribbon domain-containing protein [Betaproteobacteria bacterium]|nr:zinc ribbon domain-containing protein [Betaproteobacteria bacterium]
MPIYEYRCEACGHLEEFLQKVSEPPLAKCPSCGKKKFRKLLSAAGFQLKGSGWYATDFKGGGKSATAASEAKSDTAGAKTAESKPEAKPEAKTKTEAKPAAKPAPITTN